MAADPGSALALGVEKCVRERDRPHVRGNVPVDHEPLGLPSVYGNDRLFVYLRRDGEHADDLDALRAAGYPVVEIHVPSVYDLGAEFYRWEFATAVACHILGVNAFDQPNVEDAKKRAKSRIAEYQESGQLEAGEFVPLESAREALASFLDRAREGDYVAIMAYLPRESETSAALQELQAAIRDRTGRAVTVGFGPRFLHSTGQLHKGGPNKGLFLQITADPEEELEIPAKDMSFGTLQRAQALGDYEALEASGRRVMRIHLSRPDDVIKIKDLLKE